jgi:hypothetical protein
MSGPQVVHPFKIDCSRSCRSLQADADSGISDHAARDIHTGHSEVSRVAQILPLPPQALLALEAVSCNAYRESSRSISSYREIR